MKNSITDSERMAKLAEYIQSGLNAVTYDKRGRYITAATRFITMAPSLSKRGYKSYCKDDQVFLTDHPWAKDGVLDFLSFCGVGYKKHKSESPSKWKGALPEKRELRNEETLNSFILWMKGERDFSNSTLASYKFTAREYFSYFDTFNSDYARKYLSILESEGKSPKTICLRISALKKLAEYLGKPIKIRRPKVQRLLSTENIPTEAEYKRLCDYLSERNPVYHTLVRLMGTTGCRVSELQQFTYEMINSGSVMLKGKGGKYRQFFFTKEMQNLAKGKTGIVMINKYGGQLTARALSVQLKKYGECCGIDRSKLHPHAFRHFFAKMFLKKTKDVIQLADILGHNSVDTTRIYLQKSFQEQKREINRIVNW